MKPHYTPRNTARLPCNSFNKIILLPYCYKKLPIWWLVQCRVSFNQLGYCFCKTVHTLLRCLYLVNQHLKHICLQEHSPPVQAYQVH
ncbi:MAG: hypothetical protein EAY72_00330 [Bacteroidetes bacterium]|nr:MAG: hypothetical protein EAY72_00330 [Bacteroidota bacterium]